MGCPKIFEVRYARQKNQKYCSYQCFLKGGKIHERRINYLTLICTQCGKSFERMPCEVRKSIKNGYNNQFCSKKCKMKYHNIELGKHKRTRISVNCPICNKEFETYPNKLLQRTLPTCSQKCSGLLRRKRVKLICDYCGKEFNRCPSIIHPYNFCCLDCANHYHSNRMYKEGNPNWQGGISNLPYDSNFDKKTKKIVKLRDGGKCQLCLKEIKILAIHHIDYDKQNSSLDNLISLCERCHGKTHYNRDYWKNYFRQLMIKKIRL